MRLLAVGLLHALVVVVLVASTDDLATKPFRSADYTPHFYAALHAGAHLRNAGTLWGYDPWWMAGYPEGHVSLVDDKLFCALLLVAPSGAEALFFNAGVLLSILVLPWLVYRGARIVGAVADEAAAAAFAASVVTFSAPAPVLSWAFGGISFLLSSVLFVPVTLGLAATLCERSLWSRPGMRGAAAAVFAASVHPMAAPVLFAGLVPVLARGPRRLWSRVRDVGLLGALVGSTALPAIAATRMLRGPLRPIDPRVHDVFGGGLQQLRLDWWTHLFDTGTMHYGAGGFVAVVLLAAAALACRRPGEAERSLPVVAARRSVWVVAAFSAAIVYVVPSLAGRITVAQPHRFLMPLEFFLCIPAGRGLVLLLGAAWRGNRVAALALVALCGLVANAAGGLAPLFALGHGVDPAEPGIVDYLGRVSGDGDRVLVESTLTIEPVGAGSSRRIGVPRFGLLPLALHRECLGFMATAPFLAYRYAYFSEGRLFGREMDALTPADLDGMLRRYAISWAVACSRRSVEGLRRFPMLLEESRAIADCRVFRVREPEPSRLLEGRGRVAADLDRIRIRDASGERLVLKYHWMPGLRTEPSVPLAETREPGAPVGFISLRPEGHSDLTVLWDPPLGAWMRPAGGDDPAA